MGGNTANIGIKRQAARIGGGLGDGQADAEDGIGTQAALVLGAVQLDHGEVDIALVLGIDADQFLADVLVHRVHRLQHALAQIACLVAIAQLHSLMRAGGGTRGHSGAAKAAVFQQNVHLHRGIAPAIKDFAGVDVDDGGHGGLISCWP